MLCFVHVPKAAGTTLNFVFRQSLGYRFMELEPWVDDRRIISPADLELLRRWAPWVQHIAGHHVRVYSGLERAAPDIRYITFLRDPVRRYLSDYYHVRYKNGRVANFHEWLSNRSWMNKQTKYIAGTADAEAAKQLLKEKFQFVGLTEAMDESLVILRSVISDLPLDVRYGHPRNVGLQGPAQKEVQERWPEFEPQILENNEHDMELYAYARDVLFPQQRTDYGGALADDVAAFQESNQTARRRPWRYFAGRAHYKLLLAFYRRYGKRRWPIDNRRLCTEYDFFGEYIF